MRVFRSSLVLAFLGLTSASLLPKSLWERQARSRRLDTGLKTDGANLLSTIMDVSGGGGKMLGRVLQSLQATTGALSADEETFNQFFDTYWMLQQAPTFKEALGAGADFSDASVRSKVLTDSVNDFITLAGNMLGDALPTDAKGTTGFQSKLATFVNSGDPTVAELLDRNEQGDINATPTLQQLFFDQHYKGLDIEALKNDNFVQAQKGIIQEDPIINHYLDQNTKDVIYDDSLSFGDHVGHVDSFYTGDRGTA